MEYRSAWKQNTAEQEVSIQSWRAVGIGLQFSRNYAGLGMLVVEMIAKILASGYFARKMNLPGDLAFVYERTVQPQPDLKSKELARLPYLADSFAFIEARGRRGALAEALTEVAG